VENLSVHFKFGTANMATV